MKELKTPLLTVLIIFLSFLVYTKVFGPIPFSVDSVQTTKSNFFSVGGTGKQTAVPDTAMVYLGVTKTASTVADAQSQTNSTAGKIISDLKSLGIEDKNIKTTNYSVNPNYNYVSSKQTIDGYTVTQNLEVKIKPIEKANQVIDKVTADGANMVGGISFVLDDDVKKDLEQKARSEAVKNAKEKAQGLANAAGIRLGKIVDVNENDNNQVYRTDNVGIGGAEKTAAPNTNITPGENTITITVTLSYETL